MRRRKTKIGRHERTTRHICFIPDGDPDYEEIMNALRIRIGNQKSLSDAMQSLLACQPERFKLETTLCEWLIEDPNERIDFLVFKATS